MSTLLRRLYSLFDRRARSRVALITLAIIVGAGLEAGGAGLILPFISVVGDPGQIQTTPYLAWLYDVSGAESPRAFLLGSAVVLLVAYVVKNAYIAWLIAVQNRLVYRQYVQLSRRVLRAYLARPYDWHLQHNSADLLRSVHTDVLNIFGNIMVPLFLVFTELAIGLAVLLVLFVVAPIPATVVVGLVGATGVGFYRTFRRRLSSLGISQQLHNAEMIKSVQQALGGIKETKVLGREDFFVDRYTTSMRAFAHASEYALTINQFPRLFIETIAVAAMLLIIFVMLLQGQTGQELLPVLGLFAVASFRLMPSVSRVISSVTRIVYFRPALDGVDRALSEVGASPDSAEPAEPAKNGANGVARLERALELRDLRFSYPQASTEALRGLNITIPAGSTVAFAGPSGAGKTTTVDVILGLLAPTGGQVLVDGVDVRQDLRSWQTQIGYVPQSIYLTDDSLRRNIAFGVPDEAIDDRRIWTLLELVRLGGLVRQMRDGLDTFVGERGVRLSGGQRQRIGIARALYHDPTVLVMDEATSAVDDETERAIAAALATLAGTKTVITIAHRAATLERSGIVFEMLDGKVRECRRRA